MFDENVNMFSLVSTTPVNTHILIVRFQSDIETKQADKFEQLTFKQGGAGADPHGAQADEKKVNRKANLEFLQNEVTY